MQRYELAFLSTTIGAAPKAAPAIEAWARGGKGTLLGVWSSEIGLLNQILVLRGFADDAELAAERSRTLASSSPFGCAEWLTGLSMDAYAPFPFIPPVPEGGALGPVYEVRSYILKTGGLAPTMAAWEAQLPERLKLSPLVIAMHAVDGPPRFTHIWAYRSMEERLAIRGDAIARGIWPPKGGPECLAEMRNTICLPTAVSPLR
ncbi:NIPSNAP family protein [Roseicella aquatilis]|uniref:NIPSNAP family protein n=1 Tax=Roseicella aquatilis TaxID=2527868 RepID=A0A4R4DG36_9PROT|nr:NIPSNAP family protein [Roseicella aquatilis]TCZ59734.1 NIPSNAP family protein [Roseicella aquatilis]